MLLRNRWRSHLSQHPRRPNPGSPAVEEQPAPPDDPAKEVAEADHRAELTRRMQQVMQRDFSPVSVQAVLEYVVEERPALEVAQRFGLTSEAVYAAYKRVRRRLQQEFADCLDGRTPRARARVNRGRRR
jgi:DNA-directed RNA polymerase specialized sigma24 family protein